MFFHVCRNKLSWGLPILSMNYGNFLENNPSICMLLHIKHLRIKFMHTYPNIVEHSKSWVKPNKKDKFCTNSLWWRLFLHDYTDRDYNSNRLQFLVEELWRSWVEWKVIQIEIINWWMYKRKKLPRIELNEN